MKEKLSRLSRGFVSQKAPGIIISPESFVCSVCAGDTGRFDFTVESADGGIVKGIVCCGDPRVRLSAESFAGRRAGISFTVSAEYLYAGDIAENHIDLITDAGEYQIKYSIKVTSESGSGDAAAFPETGSEGGGMSAAESAGLNSGAPDQEERAGDPGSDGASAHNTAHNAAAADSTGYAGSRGTSYEHDTADEQDTVMFSDVEGMEDDERELVTDFLIRHFPEDEELFEDVCTEVIREGYTGRLANAICLEAVRRNYTINGLYEAYLASCPSGLDEAMPRAVLLYFSYDSGLDVFEKTVLYTNVVKFMDRSSELYREYEPGLHSFVYDCILNRYINDDLCTIYRSVLSPDMIDGRIAESVPDVLCCRRFEITDSKRANAAEYMLRIRYHELEESFVYPFRGAVCFAPCWFEDAEISVIDKYGLIYTDLPLENRTLFDRQDIMDAAYREAPEHPVLSIRAAVRTADAGIDTPEEKESLVRLIGADGLSREFRNRLIAEVCGYGGDTAWIAGLDEKELDCDNITNILTAYVYEGCFREAYLFAKKFKPLKPERSCYERIAEDLINVTGIPKIDGQTDRFFIYMLKYLFDQGSRDSSYIRILAEDYEGSTLEMFRILEAADELGIEAAALADKTLACKLFADTKEDIDHTFSIYMKYPSGNLLINAFFTARMSDYFEQEMKVQDYVFDFLYSSIHSENEIDRLPVIWLLGLTRFYADRKELMPDETDFCSRIMDLLIRKGLIFSYTKKLRKKVSIPREITEKFYVEYRADSDNEPLLLGRIEPDETDYHALPMIRVYNNIYVMSTVLFYGEKLHYLIYDSAEDDEAREEGVISVKKVHARNEDRYSMLNRMTQEMESGDIKALKADILDYIKKDEMRRFLFNAGDT